MKAQRSKLTAPAMTQAPGVPTGVTPRAPSIGPAVAVSIAYVAAGTMWIVLSEWVLDAYFPSDPGFAVRVLRGLVFVIATCVVLYVILGRMMRELQHGTRAQASLSLLLHDQSTQQRLLAHRLMQAEEETRRAVAKDLHDGPLQSLTLSFMRLDAATRNGEAHPIDPAQVATAMTAIREASDEIRAVVRALHPPLLAELGLAAAVERHCHEIASRTGREITFAREVDRDGSVDQGVAIAAFRITQEAVANAVKHTHAAAIVVRLSLHASSVEVDVTDEGPGFSPDTKVGTGLGLLSMRERAESVGGTLTVRSSRTGGTQVRLVVALAAPRSP